MGQKLLKLFSHQNKSFYILPKDEFKELNVIVSPKPARAPTHLGKEGIANIY